MLSYHLSLTCTRGTISQDTCRGVEKDECARAIQRSALWTGSTGMQDLSYVLDFFSAPSIVLERGTQ